MIKFNLRPIRILIFLLGCIIVYSFHSYTKNLLPGFGDEMNYLLQGKFFSQGKLYELEGPNKDFFKVGWMDMYGNDGKIWGFHPPGNSLILSIGWLLNLFWLPPIIIGGLNFLVQYLIGLELFKSRKKALFYLFFFSTSHYAVSLMASYMAHSPSLLFISFSYYCLIRYLKNINNLNLFLFFISLSIAFTIRPLSAFLAGAPATIYLLSNIKKNNVKTLILSILSGAIICSIVFLYTYYITGDFNFAYNIKGPETGKGLIERLNSPYLEHIRNLFVNSNNFWHRAHSFGIFGNMVIFFLALFLCKEKIVFFFYFVIHFFLISYSLLHWYGWLWEPRMIYDISFIYYILCTYGLLKLLERSKKNIKLNYILKGTYLAVSLWIIFSDIPYRLKHEYKGYVTVPKHVDRFIKKNKITNSILIFDNEIEYSTFTPFNYSSNPKDNIYIRSLGEMKNFKFIEQFPSKKIFHSSKKVNGDKTISSQYNFYLNDHKKIYKSFKKYENQDKILILPWLNFLNTKPYTKINNLKVLSEDEFINLISLGKINNRLVYFVAGSKSLEKLTANFYNYKNIFSKILSNNIKIINIHSRKIEVTNNMIEGFSYKCFDSRNWKGTISKSSISTNIKTDICPGENKSIIWETDIISDIEQKIEFFIKSDDGSGLFVNNTLEIDVDLHGEHGLIERKKFIKLNKGRNNVKIKYFNGPAQGYINIGIIEKNGFFKELKINNSLPFYFSSPLSKAEL